MAPMVFILALISVARTFHQSDYDVKFTRLEQVTFDKRFVRKGNAVTFKYIRTQAVVNITLDILADAGYELMLRVQTYKFASNEYRLYPIRFMFNFCDAVAKNDFGIADFYKCGNFSRCPIKKGNYFICNWSTNSSQFPPHVPSGDYKLEMAYVYRSMDVLVYNIYLTASRKCCKIV